MSAHDQSHALCAQLSSQPSDPVVSQRLSRGPRRVTGGPNWRGINVLIFRTSYVGLCAWAGLLVVSTAAAVAGCGDRFAECKASRTCPNPGAGGYAGEPGDAAETGGAGGAPVTAAGGAPASGGTSTDVEVPPSLGEECEDAGALRCAGPAQKLTLLCKDGVWTDRAVCDADENCDQQAGVCAPILDECSSKQSGQRYCAEDAVYQCGVDLVSTKVVAECDGKCVDSAASAECAPTTCGDGKVQAPEQCDDGNDDDTDDCTSACKEPTCGDGSVWSDHEACDDGNEKNDDACLGGCIAATCGDGNVWLGKETCDDKNKVDTDNCTNACQKATCGDGVVQAGKEECDDDNVTSGDGCSKTCMVEPVQIVAMGGGMCALGANGQLRCFGASDADWHYIDVGLPRDLKAVSIAGSSANLCALLEDGNVRCWGENGNGQLGLGDNRRREFSTESENVNLGNGAKAVSIALGGAFVCAVLADGKTKCWGGNEYNQLGFPLNTSNRSVGDVAGEMGDKLVAVPQAQGRAAATVASGALNACEVRRDGTVYCWGTNATGWYTPDSNWNLGTVLTASQIAVGTSHACAILTNRSLKCWGFNTGGCLGLDGTKDRNLSVDMGDALPVVNLGSGMTPKFVAAEQAISCAVLNDGSVKCWGRNGNGRLGSGSDLNLGDNAGEMAALKPLDLGAGRKARQVALGMLTQCALLEDGDIVCWGQVNAPTATILGDEPDEMGSKLPVVKLKF